MYVPPPFEESRIEVLHDLIEKNALGILVTHGKSGLDANHIPFELDRKQGRHGALHAHVARKNPVWQDIATGDRVLVVFRGGDAYIAPNWYPSQHDLKKQVPTWNYRVVHAHGRITVHDSEEYVRSAVERLTRIHEAGQARPWTLSDTHAHAIDEMIKAIVGLEIEITELVGKSKLGQDEELRDIVGAGEALTQRGETVIGEAMLAVAAAKKKQA